jgi:hypothetical protein
MRQNITKWGLTHTAPALMVGAKAEDGAMEVVVQLDEATLERLLREAEQAHAAYEQELGTRDDNWPAWYAHYIFQHLRPRG